MNSRMSVTGEFFWRMCQSRKEGVEQVNVADEAEKYVENPLVSVMIHDSHDLHPSE